MHFIITIPFGMVAAAIYGQIYAKYQFSHSYCFPEISLLFFNIEQPLDLSIPENKMMLAFYLAAPEVENDRRGLILFSGCEGQKRKAGIWVPLLRAMSIKLAKAGRNTLLLKSHRPAP